MLAPTGKFTVSLIFPDPLALHVPPPAPTHVQVSLVNAAANESATVAPITALGPALLATIVYVTEPPGVADVTPSVFVMERSALAASVSVSVALCAEFGIFVSLTVAVFAMLADVIAGSNATGT